MQMALFLLSMRQKFSVNPLFSVKICRLWAGAFQSLDKDHSLSSLTSNHSHAIKLPHINASSRDILEKGFRIELIDTDLVGFSLGTMKSSNEMDRDPEALASTLEVNDESSDCSPAVVAEESVDFDEIEDLRLHKRLFYKLDKGSKEFEEYNLQFHRKKSARKGQERSTEADLKKERKELQKKQKQKVVKPKVAKASEREAESSLIENGGSGTESTVMEKKRVRMQTFNQLTDSYHLPFCLDIYVSKGSVRACIVHRVTSKVVAVAHSISKDMKFELKSRKDAKACAAVGEVLAQRAIEDDIHNVVYTPRKGEKIEGKIQIVLQSIIDHGVDVKVKLKQKWSPKKIQKTQHVEDGLNSRL